MKKWLMAVLLGTLFVLGACGGGGANDNASDTDNAATEEDGGTTDSAKGEEVFQKNCASCHGDDLSGGAGPSLETVGADLSVDDIKNIIENGQGSMPPGLVSGDDQDAVAEWLATHK